jgi:glycosyltransferase involved in cell wall biosynthesis
MHIALGPGASIDDMPPLCLITQEVSEYELAQLYRSADAFVIATRGEGWGLPLVQAMAMGLPTIAPVFGGQEEFMHPDASFHIALDGVDEILPEHGYPFDPGTKWAVPSVQSLAKLLRHVVADPTHARAVGRRARLHVVRHFSGDAVADMIEQRVREIASVLRRNKKASQNSTSGKPRHRG